jgi:hypothetical protein
MTKPISLVTCFYKDADFERHAELQECLRRNCDNPLLSRIVLLVEEGSEGEKLLGDPKVETIILPKGRQTFADLVRAANERCRGEIVVFANADICFDETLSFLCSVDLQQSVYVSTRRDVRSERTSAWSFHQLSSDAWAVEAPVDESNLDIQLGKNGCESLFLGRMLRKGYRIENVSFDFKCYHMHMCNKRNYNKEVDRYPEESEMAFPVISGRAPSRDVAPPRQGPIVVDGVVFADGSSHASLWLDVFKEWREMPFGQDVIVLDRGGIVNGEMPLPTSEAPPLNNFLRSSLRHVNGILARRLGASLFLSTDSSTALGVPSVVLGTSAATELNLANRELCAFARGLSFQMADAVLCGGEDIQDVLESHYHHIGASRFHVVPLWHGGNQVFACMQAAERGFARRTLEVKERYVVFAGHRITPERTANLRVVAKALRQLGTLGILFIGGAEKLEEEVQQLFQGIPYRHVYEESRETLLALAASEGLILPNLGSAESDWSHVALACGCPVVRGAWSPRHRDGKGTLFFSPVSASSLVSVLEQVMAHDRDSIGVEAAKRAESEMRLSNARRLALALTAIRSGGPIPDMRRLLGEKAPVPEAHRVESGAGVWESLLGDPLHLQRV